MASSGKSTCCLMLIFLLIHQTVSFSVEELCARRCLYGRGGVLCNCNAMHFTGKRSKSPSSPHTFGTSQNVVEGNELDDNDEEQSEMLSSMYGTVSPLFHKYDHKFSENTDDVLENSWNRRQIENVLATLDRNEDSAVLSNQREASRNNHGGLPLLILTGNIGDVEDNDDNDLTGSTRAEVASRIKMIMGGVPFLPTSGHVPRKAEPHDRNADTEGRGTSTRSKSRDHLSRLHRVLDQALKGR